MGRETSIRVSEKEKSLLEDVRDIEFGTESVPLGEALEIVCEDYLYGEENND